MVLPVFALLIYGSFEIYRIVSVKQSLSAATYQAARCRSVRHGEYYGDDPPADRVTSLRSDEYGCEYVLLHELADNNFIDWEDLVGGEIRYRDDEGTVICVIPAGLILSDPYARLGRLCPIDPTTGLGCNGRFSVEMELFLPWPILIPGLSPENPTIGARHRSFIECGPGWEPGAPAGSTADSTS
jgi:hypothetical protein